MQKLSTIVKVLANLVGKTHYQSPFTENIESKEIPKVSLPQTVFELCYHKPLCLKHPTESNGMKACISNLQFLDQSPGKYSTHPRGF